MLVQSERNGINSSAVVGMTTNVTVADKTPYTTLVKNSLSFGDIDTAFEGFGLMSSMLQRMGGRPEFMMLNDLVTHSLNHGRLYRALEGFHAMAAWEFSPFWDKHVSRFLNGCAHTGGQALDYASDLLRLMQVCGWHFSSFHSDLFATSSRRRRRSAMYRPRSPPSTMTASLRRPASTSSAICKRRRRS